MTRAEQQTRTYYQRAMECYRSAIIAAEHGEEELSRFWREKAFGYEDQAGLLLRFADLAGDFQPEDGFDPSVN